MNTRGSKDFVRVVFEVFHRQDCIVEPRSLTLCIRQDFCGFQLLLEIPIGFQPLAKYVPDFLKYMNGSLVPFE